jgi:hypothetical protein
VRSAWGSSNSSLANDGEQLTRAVPVGDCDGGENTIDKGKVLGVDFVRNDFKLRHSFYYRAIIKKKLIILSVVFSRGVEEWRVWNII